MAAVVVDAMSGFRGTRTRDLLAGPGRPHLFLAYIGVGFAMARLPRPLWRKVLPDLDGVPYHPTMSWLAVDGYAFDRAYFDTRTWVGAQYVPPAYPWQGRPDYFPRAVDHGVGRALWFIHGGGVHEVAEAVDRFPGRRPGRGVRGRSRRHGPGDPAPGRGPALAPACTGLGVRRYGPDPLRGGRPSAHRRGHPGVRGSRRRRGRRTGARHDRDRGRRRRRRARVRAVARRHPGGDRGTVAARGRLIAATSPPMRTVDDAMREWVGCETRPDN
jgi:Protein of unknown function (DUF1702)